MALRKGIAYRHLKVPYTRKSRKKSYIKTTPATKIVKFQMGNVNKQFQYKLTLTTNTTLQIRDNAIEAARLSINRALESKLGLSNYKFIIRVYPHHILREHKMLTGAGADRMSSGMSLSFGKPVGVAAQVKAGEEIIVIGVEKNGLEIAKEAIRKIKAKLPCSTTLKIEATKVPAAVPQQEQEQSQSEQVIEAVEMPGISG
ncbi:MAG TPA: 50S ribosomal protein L16 [Nanoarchaeota archaeon]|nr:50S ribosomal protein L16 [Nanoarchaeota archaeon]HIH51015.1 50S ribosomal protein L16 [Nanoarchaeota archaeon]